MSLSPELRQRIFEEERFRLEARERAREQIRLQQRNASLAVTVVLIVGLFLLGYGVSSTLLARWQAIPPSPPPALQPTGLVTQVVLDDVARVLQERVPGAACVRTVGRGQPQIKATVELAEDVAPSVARRLALAKATEVGAALRRQGLALPAYVEIFSPARWYGMGVYDRDTLKVSWDPCPGRCEQEGTRHVRRCPAPKGEGTNVR
jgi:hypothetical protein